MKKILCLVSAVAAMQACKTASDENGSDTKSVQIENTRSNDPCVAPNSVISYAKPFDYKTETNYGQHLPIISVDRNDVHCYLQNTNEQITAVVSTSTKFTVESCYLIKSPTFSTGDIAGDMTFIKVKGGISPDFEGAFTCHAENETDNGAEYSSRLNEAQLNAAFK